ncbi:Uncharacterised protein [Providencia rettgeri]|nr:Uncharacterised protein [Providencia rettgeri]
MTVTFDTIPGSIRKPGKYLNLIRVWQRARCQATPKHF